MHLLAHTLIHLCTHLHRCIHGPVHHLMTYISIIFICTYTVHLHTPVIQINLCNNEPWHTHTLTSHAHAFYFIKLLMCIFIEATDSILNLCTYWVSELLYSKFFLCIVALYACIPFNRISQETTDSIPNFLPYSDKASVLCVFHLRCCMNCSPF